MTISEEIREKLLGKGASIVGYADLSAIPEKDRKGYRYGIIIGIALNPEIILGIKNGPTIEYYEEYKRINTLLNKLDEFTEGLIKGKGFEALAKTQKVVEIDENSRRTELPHKTVATRAGIGWIGKCALLVTKEYGSAIKISSVLTNAELEVGIPINNSGCGDCSICKNICPAGAVSGEIWEVNKDRDEFYNAFDCRKTARERSGRIGLNESLCGLCILACPWTQRYLKRNSMGNVKD
jgi:epoxyqueuosine reductase